MTKGNSIPSRRAASIGVGALLVLCGAAATAQTLSPIVREGGYYVQQESGELQSATRLRVSAAGNVAIQGSNQGMVSYSVTRRVKAGSEGEAQRLLDRARLTAARRGDAVTLQMDSPNCWNCGFQSDLSVQAPFATREAIVTTTGGRIHVTNIEGRLTADTSAGPISAENIGGGVRADTAGGPITLGDIGGPVRCDTAGGRITVGSVRGDAVLSTSGGGIEVGEVRGSLRAESSGGGIHAKRVAGTVFAGTSGGDISIGEALGRVIAETAGGAIEVAKAPQGVTAETAGGPIRLTQVAGAIRVAAASGNIEAIFLDGQPLADSFIETNSGTIVVFLPASLRVAIEATVDFGRNLNRIQSDFADIQVVRSAEGFGSGEVRGTGAINGGGPVLRIRNTSGRIQIRRLEE